MEKCAFKRPRNICQDFGKDLESTPTLSSVASPGVESDESGSEKPRLFNHFYHFWITKIIDNSELHYDRTDKEIKRECVSWWFTFRQIWLDKISWNRSANCEILVGHPQKWPESLKQQKLKDRTRKACKKSKLVTFGNTTFSISFAFCPTWLLQHTNSLHGYSRSKLMLWLCCCVVLLVVYSRKKIVLFDACLRAVARDASSQTCGG